MKIAAAAPPLPGCWNGQRRAMEEQEEAVNDTPPRKKEKKNTSPKTQKKEKKKKEKKKPARARQVHIYRNECNYTREHPQLHEVMHFAYV